MNTILFIIYINTLVWLLVPIKQYNTRFFLFFLVLGLFDPVFISSYYIFKLDISILYLIGTVLLLYFALLDFRKINRLILSLVFLIISTLVAFHYKEKIALVELVIHLIIFFNFLKIILKEYSTSRRVLVFSVFLITYEISLVVKFFMSISQVDLGVFYFHFTSIIQVALGLLFLFINEKNSPLIKI
jgi:hypothetical protein